MKKTLLATLFLIASLFMYANAQDNANLAEPEFTGEVFLVKDGQSEGLLEKSPVQVKSKAGAGVYIVGIGSVKTRMTVAGCCSGVRFNTSDKVQFIVRAVDNKTDPTSIIRIFEFDKKKKERRAELASSSTFGGTSSNNLKLLTFTAKKFGEGSYLITPDELREGEFGIHITNPNALDEKMTVVSTFGIDAAGEIVAE